MNSGYKTDKWFVSPWCYLPEVRKGFDFPAKIRIHDVTLRDGEQQTGVIFRREEKVEIAKQLAALGVQRIEAGMPAVSQQDRAAISDIADLELGPEIFSFARCIVGDIKTAKECGVSGVIVEIPSSDHIADSDREVRGLARSNGVNLRDSVLPIPVAIEVGTLRGL